MGSIPTEVKIIFSLPRVVFWFPLLGLTPGGSFMGFTKHFNLHSRVNSLFHHIATWLVGCNMLLASGQPVATCCALLAQIWPFSNLRQQCSTRRKRVEKRAQHVATPNVANVWSWHVAIVLPGLEESRCLISATLQFIYQSGINGIFLKENVWAFCCLRLILCA